MVSNRRPRALVVGHSCLMFFQDAGRNLTVEALDVMESWRSAGAWPTPVVRMRICTPGFVVSILRTYRTSHRTCDAMARRGIYAVHRLSPMGRARNLGRRQRVRKRLNARARADTVLHNGFSRPATIDDCLALMREKTAAPSVAGETVWSELNLLGARWPNVISSATKN